MCADIVHEGHLNVISEGARRGKVIIGLLTDEAIAAKKRLPYMSYDARYKVVSNLKAVEEVVPQDTPDYRPNLNRIKPDFVIHGNDWHPSKKQQVIDAISEWQGELIEVEYTPGISSSIIQERSTARGITPGQRMARLKQLLDKKPIIRALEAHDGLSALVVERTQFKHSGTIEQFDAIWISSLSDSIAKGKPDNEVIDRTSRLATINEVLEVTTKPLIVDGDTGGQTQHFVHTVRTLERLGVSAVVIEDKTGLKLNSFDTTEGGHIQDDKDAFAAKVKAGINARITKEFMIIARIESLVLGAGQRDALGRAQAYLDAGASAIMIHSKSSNGQDVRTFCDAYSKLENRQPLMVVPTTFDMISEDELMIWGANIVVYANHLIRAAYPAMARTAETILASHRSFEASQDCYPIQDLLNLPRP
jgi:phosphoenolpyruvate phosphomutase